MRLLALLSAAVPAAAQSLPKNLQKIIQMLNDLEDTLEKEKLADAEQYKHLECWCDHNNYGVPLTTVQEEIKSAIEDAQVQIQTCTASKSRFTVEIEQQEVQLKEDNEEKASAQTGFAKEMQKLQAEIQDLSVSTTQLKSALVVLSGAGQGAGLSQKKVVLKLRSNLSNHLTSDKLQKIDQVLDETADLFGDTKFLQTSSKQAPASGEIVGILKQMLDEFTDDLAERKQSKIDTEETHKKQIKNLDLRIEATTRQNLQSKTGLAEASTCLSENKDALKENNALMGDLIKHHSHVQKTCKEEMEAYQAKVAARAEEVAVVRDVIEFFNNDENQVAFRTANTGFLQLRSQSKPSRKKEKAASLVLAQAKKKEEGPFETVVAAMEEMIVNLKAEDEQDKVHKDECVENLSKNREEATKIAADMNETQAEIDKLNAELEGINKDLKDTEAEVAQLDDDMKKMEETRAEEKERYDKEHAEQKLSLKLLGIAMGKLRQVYSFVQQPSEPGGEHSFAKNPSGPNSAGSKIVLLFETVIDDTNKTIKTMETEETDAVNNYKEEKADAIAKKDNLQSKLTNITGEKSNRDTKLLNANQKLADLQTQAATNQATGDSFHQSCDFLINNYDARLNSRREEVEAVREAITILQGVSLG